MPVSLTLTLGTIGGSISPGFSAGDHVCVAGSYYPEQAIITSVGAVAGGTQSITLPVSNPNFNAAVFKGGVCGNYISFDGDLALGQSRSSYFAFGSINGSGTDLIYGFQFQGQLGTTLPLVGNEPVTTTGSGTSSGFHLYCGAEIVENTSTANEPLLEPNLCNWSPSDAVENPDNPAVHTEGIRFALNQSTPANGGDAMVGLDMTIGGIGAANSAKGIWLKNSNFDPSIYSFAGGLLATPVAGLQVDGFWSNTVEALNAPSNALLSVQNMLPGQSEFAFARMPHSSITYSDSTSGFSQFYLQGAGINSQGPATFQGGVSLQGGLNLQFSGASFASYYPGQTPTLLSLRNTSPYVSDTSMCLGDGTSSSPYVSTCNRDLNLNNLAAAGSVTATSGSFTGAVSTPVLIPPGGSFCVNSALATCPDGASIPSSGAGGIDISGQTIGGTFGSGGNLLLIANTPGDTNTGAALFLGGSARGDSEKNALQVNANGNAAIRVDGDALGHNIGNVGIGYANGSVVPNMLSVNGTVGASLYTGPLTAPIGSCSTVGWVFSQDGHATFCNGSTWVAKI